MRTFEEYGFCFETGRNYYANMPDPMFPIPFRDGQVIPYDRFRPPGEWFGVMYIFYDLTVIDAYVEQMKEAGFDGEYGFGEDGIRRWGFDWLFTYDRMYDSMRLTATLTIMPDPFHYSHDDVLIMSFGANHVDSPGADDDTINVAYYYAASVASVYENNEENQTMEFVVTAMSWDDFKVKN